MQRLPILFLLAMTLALWLLAGIDQTATAQQPLPTSVPGTLSGSDRYLRNPHLGLAHISAAEGGTSEARYRTALTLGAGWNRWPIYWDRVEATPGARDWSRYDRQVVDDLRHRLNINAILIGIPPFMRDGGRIEGMHTPIFSDGSDLPGPGKTFNPDNPWASFVFDTVERYRPGGVLSRNGTLPAGRGITVWEIWNEPDFPQFWSSSINDYARLLKIAYIAAKQADPNAQIMFGGLLFNTQDNWLARVLAIYQNDPYREQFNWYMDIVAVHAYANPWRTGWLVLNLEQTLIAYQLDKPVWITEMGAPVWDDYPGPTWAANSDGRINRATLQQQAWYMIQSAAYGWQEGAEVIIVHQLYDDCGDQAPGTNFPPHNGELCASGACFGDAHGLYRNPATAICFSQHPQPGTPRPAARAYRLLAEVFMEPFEPAGEIQEDRQAVVLAFRRSRSGEMIYVMWNRLFEETTLSLPAQGLNGQLISLGGSRVISPDGDGLYQITLAPNPPVNARSAIGGEPLILVEQPEGDVRIAEIDLSIDDAENTETSAPPTPVPQQPAIPPRPTVDPAQDRTPPVVRMNALPVTSAANFTVNWSGEDDSGIDYFQVWLRIDRGEWQPWLETTETSATVNGVLGSLYEFDVWAVDLAGNWTPDVNLRVRASTRVQE